jgi:hypothetical protein
MIGISADEVCRRALSALASYLIDPQNADSS